MRHRHRMFPLCLESITSELSCSICSWGSRRERNRWNDLSFFAIVQCLSSMTMPPQRKNKHGSLWCPLKWTFVAKVTISHKSLLLDRTSCRREIIRYRPRNKMSAEREKERERGHLHSSRFHIFMLFRTLFLGNWHSFNCILHFCCNCKRKVIAVVTEGISRNYST